MLALLLGSWFGPMHQHCTFIMAIRTASIVSSCWRGLYLSLRQACSQHRKARMAVLAPRSQALQSSDAAAREAARQLFQPQSIHEGEP